MNARADGAAASTDASSRDDASDRGETGACRGERCDEIDGDSDGVPARTDCSDRDPSVGSTQDAACMTECGSGVRRCMDGWWGECSAPRACDCATGTSPRTIDCGNCGSQRQTCEDGRWVDDGACAGAGACAPAAEELGGGCGHCGLLRRVCGSDCAWGAWLCEDEGACRAGTDESRTETCGACGEGTRSATRRCDATCTWSAWEPGSCTTSATCSPGETSAETAACPGGCGTTQQRTRSCDATTCTWGAYGAWSTCPACGPSCGDGACGGTETCASCSDCRNGHLGTADGGGSCAGVPAETWRCVYSPMFRAYTSQVCRGGIWQIFVIGPRDCATCVCAFNASCCAASGCT